MWKKWVQFVLSFLQLNHQLTRKVFKIIFTFKNEAILIYKEEHQKL